MRSRSLNVVVFLCVLPGATSLGAENAASPLYEGPWRRHTIDDSSRGADGVRLADANGDGLSDIATGWEEGGLVRVYLNPGHEQVRHRWPAVTVGRVGDPEDAVFVDLDRDGALDVVSASEGKTRTLWVHWAPADPAEYLNEDAWRTEAVSGSQGSRRWMFCLPMQIDRRAGLDLLTGSKGDNAELGWFECPRPARPRANDRSGLRTRWHPILRVGWIMSLVPRDMDGDGDVDVVVSNRGPPNRGCFWVENPGPWRARRRSWPIHPVGGGGREVMFLTVADLDGDGTEEVITATRQQDLLCFRRDSSEPEMWRLDTIVLPANAGTGKAVAAGDVDLDGHTDLVVTCEHAHGKSGVLWLSRDHEAGDPRWTAHDISGLPGAKYDLVELLDLDGDGDLDVLTCEERENLGVIWYENPSR